MSAFSIPKNAPSFTNSQHGYGNNNWRAAAGTDWSISSNSKRVMGNMQGFFEPSRNLPLYKDKPYAYISSRRPKPLWKRKTTYFTGGIILIVLYFIGLSGNRKEQVIAKTTDTWSWLSKLDKGESNQDWLNRREKVKDAFTSSWDAYERYAWGFDEFHPVSKNGRKMAPNGLGWIIVDALDTMILMNLTSRLSHAREWLSTSLNYEQNQDVNTFETTIRMLGGLLSAHYLSTEFPHLAPLTDDDEGAIGEDLYLEKAKDLADRIMGAFDSPSGIPFASFILETSAGIPSHDDNGASSTAEAGSVQLEFKYLSKLTGETLYWKTVEKVIQVIDDNGSKDGLVPIYIYAHDGHFRGSNIRLGSRGDSYYEYLIKQYLQTSKEEPIYKEMWDEALMGVRKHLITYSKPSKITVLGERPNGLEEELSPKMDHLVCFMPGTIALGATGGISESEARKLPSWTKRNDEEMQLARELMQTCWAMYKVTPTGLAPEIVHFNIDNPPLPESAPHVTPENLGEKELRENIIIKSNDNHNLQRPETVESLFYMWRITGDVKYREWGWEMFKSFMEHTAVDGGVGGFTSLANADIIPPVTKDNMESFWLAETLKYFYLLFSPNDLVSLDQVVINTEAHFFPRFSMGQLFETGWTRKPRGPDGLLV
ncbi:Mannosyl-oligosaccharide 1,2-alpha-mannosidase [Podosphaera aphanis]|nr:Mannosyl-oligosaccharide 1,2-alpha-mannosidase [Podosphaera aphanis]